ncbi:hypothetical protein FD754_004077 [Muntiacus muntjak]|uniref:Uncharacterized protein n=1 Tax=Muntiacus muntjak TaxID=9888 RepID=A0A5N3WDT8_MUNMU|nr:hypothetical protein FD754_004077 [Muntiacus muntjak]
MIKAFLSLLAILWNSAFKWVYLSFFPLLFTSLVFPIILSLLRLHPITAFWTLLLTMMFMNDQFWVGVLRTLVIVLPKKKNKENTGKNPKIISELWKIPNTETEQIGNLEFSDCTRFEEIMAKNFSDLMRSLTDYQRDQVSRALKTEGNTPKYGLIFHSTLIEQVEEQLSFCETGEIPQKNLDVMKGAMVQAEEVAAEITRKLEKWEKKRLKKEKKRLAAIALASSENSSAPEECEETSERPKKKKKQKLQEALQENGMESVSFPKPKIKKSFSKEELVSSDLEETAGTGSLPKRKKSFPKEETVTDPDESENKRVPKKKWKLSKEEPLSSGPEEAAASKSSGSKKKKKLRKLSLES